MYNTPTYTVKCYVCFHIIFLFNYFSYFHYTKIQISKSIMHSSKSSQWIIIVSSVPSKAIFSLHSLLFYSALEPVLVLISFHIVLAFILTKSDTFSYQNNGPQSISLVKSTVICQSATKSISFQHYYTSTCNFSIAFEIDTSVRRQKLLGLFHEQQQVLEPNIYTYFSNWRFSVA